MTGTDIKVIAPAATEILGPDVHRLAPIHTNAKTDAEMLEVWLKSHADGSPQGGTPRHEIFLRIE